MSQVPEIPATAPAAPATPSRLARFWRHPITQLLARIAFFILAAAAVGYLLRQLIHLPKLEGEGAMAATLTETGATPWLRQLRNLLPPIIAYYLMVRLLERRPLDEFAPRKAPLHSLAGWLTGMGILLAAAAVLAVPGFYAVHGTHADAPLLAPLLTLGIGAGVGEEIVARGVLFRVVEECFGTWFALRTRLGARVFAVTASDRNCGSARQTDGIQGLNRLDTRIPRSVQAGDFCA